MVVCRPVSRYVDRDGFGNVKGERSILLRDLKNFRNIPRNGQLFLINELLWTLGIGIFEAIFNLYLLKIGLGISFIGLTSSVRLMLIGFTAVPLGVFASRVGLRNSMLLGNVLLFAALGAQLLAEQMWMLLVFIGAEGVAVTLRRVVKSPFMAEQTTKSERPYLFSSNAAMMNFSKMTGSALGGFLPVLIVSMFGLEDYLSLVGLKGALWVGVVLTGSGIVPLLMMRVRPPAANEQLWQQVGKVMKNRTAWELVISYSLIAIGTGLVVPLFNVFLVDQFGAGTVEVGTIKTLSLLGLSLTTLLSPAIARHFGVVRGTTYAQLASLPFLLLIVVLPGLFWAGTAAILRLSFMDMMNPARNTLSMNLVREEERAPVNSMVRMGQTTAEGAAAGMAGWMMEHWGNTTPYILAIAAYVFAIVYFQVRFRKYDRDTSHRYALKA